MWWRRKNSAVVSTPVLAVDALGIGAKLKSSNEDQLIEIRNKLEHQFFNFKSRVPYSFVMVGKKWVWGTGEFKTLRLNDMFILYSPQTMTEDTFRYLITASLLYHTMLLEEFIPRGGLGYGLVTRGDGLLIGPGFIEAYEYAENRSRELKDICAIQLSPNFVSRVPRTMKAYRLICFYKGAFFLHPCFLNDPEIGQFDNQRILDLLDGAGANDDKLSATEHFLEHLEEANEADKPDSKSRAFLSRLSSSQDVG